MKRLPLLFAALLVAALAGCVPGQPSPTKACDVEVLEPMISLDDPSLIIGQALAVCDVPPTEHVMQVSVEWVQGDQWLEVPGINARPYTECTDIPTPGVGVPCAHVVPCIDGHYRTAVVIFGSGPSGPFSFLPPERPDAVIKCPRL